MMLKLAVVLVSTRPGRKGPPIAKWFYEFARQHGSFELQFVDLAEVNLPVLDEPNHPRLQKYTQDHTRAWSAIVAAADTFVFVTPEYNYSTPPSLVNALDYLYVEWNYKPAAFVSYGGLSGGMRSVQMSRQILTALKMVPIVEAVTIPFFTKHLDEAGHFVSDEHFDKSATDLLKELHKWAQALQPLHRADKASS
ncbi:MAG: NADPH-dependent FMN reductase [Candidatus Sericytochromatia bacterium]